MMAIKKIMVFPVPAVGHSNPILKTTKELIKKYNAKVIVYSIDTFKTQIENTGAEYRKLDDSNHEDFVREINFNNDPVDLIYRLLVKNFDLSDKHSLKLANDIEEEKPDLILHDTLSYFVKVALRILKKRPTSYSPKVIAYWATFVHDSNIYPNEYEKSISQNLTFFQKIQFIWVIIKISHVARSFAKKYNLEYKTPIEDFISKDPKVINIVFTFPELHPRSHLFDRKTIFVGSCIDENAHINGEVSFESTQINDIIKSFPILSLYNERTIHDRKLIFVSLGTTFNENQRIFSIIINAIKKFDAFSAGLSDSTVKFKDMTVLMSLGPSVYKQFQELIESKKLDIPENIILAPSVPQLEILKRASLFITHSGLNSTSESIHFAVPMICIPLNADQPLNAHRVATELGLGVILYFKTMTESDVCDAMNKILIDFSFYDRCRFYSRLSRQYIGQENAANLVMKTIEN